MSFEATHVPTGGCSLDADLGRAPGRKAASRAQEALLHSGGLPRELEQTQIPCRFAVQARSMV